MDVNQRNPELEKKLAEMQYDTVNVRWMFGPYLKDLAGKETPPTFLDLVSVDECFEGGAILAGQQASALALSAGTDLLPVISTYRLDDPPTVVGRATESANADAGDSARPLHCLCPRWAACSGRVL